jgi:hypothetical protein
VVACLDCLACVGGRENAKRGTAGEDKRPTRAGWLAVWLNGFTSPRNKAAIDLKVGAGDGTCCDPRVL